MERVVLEPSCQHFLIVLNGLEPLDHQLLPELLDECFRAFVDVLCRLPLQINHIIVLLCRPYCLPLVCRDEAMIVLLVPE